MMRHVWKCWPPMSNQLLSESRNLHQSHSTIPTAVPATPVFLDYVGKPIVIGPACPFANKVSRKLKIRKSHSILERCAPSTVTLTVIRGVCCVEVAGVDHLVGEQAHIDIPPNIKHRITALTDVRAIETFYASDDCQMQVEVLQTA